MTDVTQERPVATPDDDMAEVVPIVTTEAPSMTNMMGSRARAAVSEKLSWNAIKQDLIGVKALRKTKYGLSPLLVLMFVGFAQALDDGIFSALGPEIRKDLGISIKTLSDIGFFTGAIGLALGPLVGHLSDRHSRVRMLGISSILSGIFSLVTAKCYGAFQIFTARTVDGASEQLGSTPANTLLFDYYPVEARGKVSAFSGTVGTVVGLFLAPTLGGLAVIVGWRTPFLITGPLMIFTGFFVMRKLKDPIRGYWERQYLGASEETAMDPEPPVRASEAIRTVLAIRTLRRNLTAQALTVAFSGAFQFLLGFYMLEKFRLNAFQRSLIGIPSHITGLIGLIVGGALTDVLIRYRPSRVIVAQGLLGLVGALSVLVTILAPSMWFFLIFNTLFSFFRSLTIPASAVISAQILPPRLRGFGYSIVGSAMGVISIFGGPLGGRVQAAFGIRNGLLLLYPIMIVGPLIGLSAAKFFEFDMRAAFASAMAKDQYRRAKLAGGSRLLICKDVDVSYGSVQVLFNVDLTLEEGEIVALLGTNGAGKSTLLRAISGTHEASNGAIYMDGRDITHLPPNDISTLGVVSMPGGKAIFPGLTVSENLRLALWNCPPDEAEGRIEEVLDFFPVLRDRMQQDAGSLSGGEQQMVALGQAFLGRPRLLMIDELSLGLSPAIVAQLLDIVRAIHAQGTTIVLVEQSVNVALSLASRAVFMEKGEVKFEGATADLLTRPDLMRSVYVKGAGALTGGTADRRSTEVGRPLLEVAGLTKRYGGKLAVDDVSFTLHEGEALGIIGPNGAGKTTLFDLISGRQRADSGTVFLDGVDLSNESADARARARLVRRFQDARLFPSLTVHETLCVALERRLDVRNTFVLASRMPAGRKSERRAKAAADRLIELFDLGSYRDKFVSDLSTGLRRVVDLACVIAAEPRVLLLDEPSSGIAQAEAENLAPLLRRVRYETGCSLLIIEHDMPLIRNVSNELIGMAEGRIIIQGPAEDVLGHPTIVSAYLGDNTATIQRQGEIT
ncbi:MAG: branched-chain amino acid transport system ATP-binding protein [Acidimicrobiaceae bacterium]|nr:branched-chain amino acid transport system ATP-binding protein [Acidimicrobiaceae bacterium]